jgi:hypothetical protein
MRSYIFLLASLLLILTYCHDPSVDSLEIVGAATVSVEPDIASLTITVSG